MALANASDSSTSVYRLLGILMCLLFAGCSSPAFTRYPQFWTGHPGTEGRDFQQQDPFPSPDIGPDMMSRPPDFARPRTEARQAAEQRLLQGAPALPSHLRPGNPRGGLNRPGAVY